MMRFRTETAKKLQAAAVLLRLEKGQMDVIRLIKLLYIADREAIQETGKPIVGGRVVAMDNGPVHSEVYDLVKGQHPEEAIWSEFLDKDGHNVILKRDPGRLDLSPYEIEKLTEVSERYAAVDNWELVERTHDFEEYTACYQAGTSKTIPLSRLLHTLGFSDDEIADVQRDADAHGRLLKAFEE